MSLFSRWFGNKERRILILGLDGAGIELLLNIYALKLFLFKFVLSLFFSLKERLQYFIDYKLAKLSQLYQVI
jgi:hypothetical protein